MTESAKILPSEPERELALMEAAKAWRALGVGYAIRDAGQPTAPEALLLSTTWLFAYDFHFASLVSAWVKYRGDVLDLDHLKKVLRAGNSFNGLSTEQKQLGLAYLFSLARTMVWQERGGLRRRLAWFAIAKAIRSSLGSNSLFANKLIDRTRLEDINRLVKEMRLRADPYLNQIGLDLPWLGIEEERKLLPKAYVRRQVACVR